MTRNQIEYSKLLELQRSNRMNEQLTQQRDEATRTYQVGSLKESARHNLASEGLTGRQLSESERHNRSTESQALQVLDESRRHNQAFERNAASVLAEQIRSNMANERERNRANLAHEAEYNRSNLAREDETHRSNVERERETKRSNIANEVIRSGSLANEVARTAETSRHNVAYEAETARHNLAMELKEYGKVSNVYNNSFTIPGDYGTRTDVIYMYPAKYGDSAYMLPEGNTSIFKGGRSGGGFGGRRSKSDYPTN